VIVEGIVTTERQDGSMHASPIGPWVDPSTDSWSFRPFQSSQTFANMHRSGRCVFHLVDDPLILVEALRSMADVRPHRYQSDFGHILDDCCSWLAFSLDSWDLSQPRAVAQGRKLYHQQQRPFRGWNRAAHGILEGAVLFSRLSLLGAQEVQRQFSPWIPIIRKTGGEGELQALDLLLGMLPSTHRDDQSEATRQFAGDEGKE
jgi:hypothetical protein